MLDLIVFLSLMTLGFIFGTYNEKRHFLELKEREKNLLHIPIMNHVPRDLVASQVFAITGSVVVASDYFKNFVGNLKNIFGGRLTTHEALMDRARREAICRLKEKAVRRGANEIVDVRLETAFIDGLGIEVMAYGTAIKK